MLSDSELGSLLGDMESDRVERKASASERDKIRQAICAFANDLPDHRKPGVIFIGANDDGTCANLDVTDKLLQMLGGMRDDGSILPFPSMTVQKREIANCRLAVVEVLPSDMPPVRHDGRVWIRVGPRRARATAEEERRLIERRRWGALTFDQQPAAGATLDDLDLDVFRQEYLPSAVPPGVLEENDRPLEQQLKALRFLGPNGMPNHAAMLLFGRDPRVFIPGAYVQFVRFVGSEITDSIRLQKELSGRLNDILWQIDELLSINVSVSGDVSAQPTEIKIADYPIVALQQFARNALMHRSYESTNAPVRIYWFDDRIEITNPGGLYGQVTPENFGTVADYRNPLIAEALKVLGYVQRFGMGIPLALRELEKNGSPVPEFEFYPSYLLVRVRKRP